MQDYKERTILYQISLEELKIKPEYDVICRNYDDLLKVCIYTQNVTIVKIVSVNLCGFQFPHALRRCPLSGMGGSWAVSNWFMMEEYVLSTSIPQK